jgi:hypothetical protein
MASSLDELIQRADLDGLVRHVDDTCSSRDWDHLLRIRDDARNAVKTGRQLWPIATLANYRLALWAPAHLAVRALDDAARTFMPGPVSEILALHNSWEDLEPHLEFTHDRSLVAYERALRGDVIPPHEDHALEIPFAPAPWEPPYALASYNDDGVVDDMPSLSLKWHTVDTREADALEDDTVPAFARMMEPWTAHSNGVSRAVVVDGEIEDAFGALGLHDVSFSQMTTHNALQWLTWAASSGGAHGKRRGVATGRSEALWLLATFTGLDDSWPRSFAELGDVITNQLEFFVFTADKHSAQGWWLQLAVVDPNEGLTAAFIARDFV